ncbi:MAG: hypothetical protein J6W05_05040 [Prevotella sp.]|nr:hypothetical protein [Prevotella sp.]
MGCAGLLLAGLAATGFYGWDAERKTVKELEAQIEELKQKEMRSAVDRSVSAQMEEIANEQREISDEKREEALRQTRVANEMRLRSELERQNALEAERNAVAQEKIAREASEVAESQRQMAEHQRIQAEFSKRKADTLSYIALGRSLGSISTILYQAGNDEIANTLSYASYLYTSRYGGDIFNPAIFQSLIQMSKSMTSWTEHTGAVMNIEYLNGSDTRLVSVSNYGEIIVSERQGNRLQARTLFNDSKYDFRDVDSEPNGCIYAISRTGQLVIIQDDQKTVKILDFEGIGHPIRLHRLRDNMMLAVGENGLAVVDEKRKVVRATQPLPFQVITSARKDGEILLFDDQGMMHLLKGLDQYTTMKVPAAGKVTAYHYSKESGIEAYGMSDGTIWTVDNKGNMHKLIGHRSRISKVTTNGRLLYSSSYDGSVKLWIPTNEKVESMTMVENGNWIMTFDFDPTKTTFWLGDIKGNLTAVNISVPQMVDVIKKKIKQNLTTEEWNYYIGQDVPYERFVEK